MKRFKIFALALALMAVFAAVFANVYPFGPGGATEALTAPACDQAEGDVGRRQ